jgi:hypothetical protein
MNNWADGYTEHVKLLVEILPSLARRSVSSSAGRRN